MKSKHNDITPFLVIGDIYPTIITYVHTYHVVDSWIQPHLIQQYHSFLPCLCVKISHVLADIGGSDEVFP